MRPRAPALGVQHAPHNAMTDADEIARFHDRCSDLMRALLGALAAAPDRPRPFPEIEDELNWPHRRIASVLGGVSRLRLLEFDGRRPYRFLDERHSGSGRWEMWVDRQQASAIAAAQHAERAEHDRQARSAAHHALGDLVRAPGDRPTDAAADIIRARADPV